MDVEARNMSILSTLKKGEFIIPDFQREYDWDDYNIDEFFNDINNSNKGDNYFIGHMVFEGNFNGNRFNVIDGQQRITTITIMLCAIRDRFLELGNIDLATGIHTQFIFAKDVNNKEYAILVNNMPYPVLQARLQSMPNERNESIKPKKDGEKRILSAYEQITTILKSFNSEQLQIFRDKVLGLETIFVAAEGLTDAYSIFKTLNATGKDLTPMDLTKNYLFSLYPKQSHVKEPADSWKIILENINVSKSHDKFLNNFFSSRYKKVSDQTLYREIVLEIGKDKNKAKEFLDNLKADSEIFKLVTYPQCGDWSNNNYNIYESLNAIVKIFKIEIANTFLITLIRDYKNNYISKEILIQVLHTIEKFHFIYNAICSKRSSGYDNFYSKYSRILFEKNNKNDKHRVIREVIKFLNDKIVDKKEFDVNFNNKVYYSSKETKQKSLVQYILIKIERQKNANAILKDISIEHIYPENAESKIKPLKDKNLFKTIGNLVLLDKGLNSEIGNKDYDTKKRMVLEKSNLITTKNVFTTNNTWSDSEINQRTEDIKSYMYNLKY